MPDLFGIHHNFLDSFMFDVLKVYRYNMRKLSIRQNNTEECSIFFFYTKTSKAHEAYIENGDTLYYHST